VESVSERHWKKLSTKVDVKSTVKITLFRVIAKKSVPSVLNEKTLLASL
jgi:hypothetical protein